MFDTITKILWGLFLGFVTYCYFFIPEVHAEELYVYTLKLHVTEPNGVEETWVDGLFSTREACEREANLRLIFVEDVYLPRARSAYKTQTGREPETWKTLSECQLTRVKK